jgi:hypothetical protein
VKPGYGWTVRWSLTCAFICFRPSLTPSDSGMQDNESRASHTKSHTYCTSSRISNRRQKRSPGVTARATVGCCTGMGVPPLIVLTDSWSLLSLQGLPTEHAGKMAMFRSSSNVLVSLRWILPDAYTDPLPITPNLKHTSEVAKN